MAAPRRRLRGRVGHRVVLAGYLTAVAAAVHPQPHPHPHTRPCHNEPVPCRNAPPPRRISGPCYTCHTDVQRLQGGCVSVLCRCPYPATHARMARRAARKAALQRWRCVICERGAGRKARRSIARISATGWTPMAIDSIRYVRVHAPAQACYGLDSSGGAVWGWGLGWSA